MLYNTSKNYL